MFSNQHIFLLFERSKCYSSIQRQDLFDNGNYRSVSILSLLSKIFGKLSHRPSKTYIERFQSSILCGFRKAHNTYHAMFRLLHSWQNQLDQKGFAIMILMDFSNAYDCIPHDLLMAKFECYGIDKIGFLGFLFQQRSKIGFLIQLWYDTVRSVPQVSVLGFLIFILFISFLFYVITLSEVCYFANESHYLTQKKSQKHSLNILKQVLIMF